MRIDIKIENKQKRTPNSRFFQSHFTSILNYWEIECTYTFTEDHFTATLESDSIDVVEPVKWLLEYLQ